MLFFWRLFFKKTKIRKNSSNTFTKASFIKKKKKVTFNFSNKEIKNVNANKKMYLNVTLNVYMVLVIEFSF